MFSSLFGLDSVLGVVVVDSALELGAEAEAGVEAGAADVEEVSGRLDCLLAD